MRLGGYALRELGLAEAGRGRVRQGVRLLEESLRVARQQRARYEQLLTLEGWAGLAQARPGRGREKAGEAATLRREVEAPVLAEVATVDNPAREG